MADNASTATVVSSGKEKVEEMVLLNPTATLASCEQRLQDAKELLKSTDKAVKEDAVEKMADILEAMVTSFGDEALECANFHLEYGYALLCQAQDNSDALGGTGGDAEEGGDDGDDDAELEAAMRAVIEGKGVPADERPAADDLEVAWEVLEIARMSYSQAPPTKENELQLAETYQTIGEVGLESESFAQAIEDFTKCLKLLKKWHTPGHRDIANVYNNLAMACMYDIPQRASEALSHYKAAVAVFAIYIQEQRAKLETPSETYPPHHSHIHTCSIHPRSRCSCCVHNVPYDLTHAQGGYGEGNT
jgi:tetratricopeptide (TPR) repeat protein